MSHTDEINATLIQPIKPLIIWSLLEATVIFAVTYYACSIFAVDNLANFLTIVGITTFMISWILVKKNLQKNLTGLKEVSQNLSENDSQVIVGAIFLVITLELLREEWLIFSVPVGLFSLLNIGYCVRKLRLLAKFNAKIRKEIEDRALHTQKQKEVT
ncbi:MAG: hypothetical protein G01um101420_418 [Parcubacteria group bacterium Gr01-1014_20]|nr:MAG: hypothetical protein G01um101420_418 [Parcubacteria group bacterium Gr01-1014_20]